MNSVLSDIKHTLNKCGISLNNCVTQTYDCSNEISGVYSGVHSLPGKQVPEALYVHSMNRCLNLLQEVLVRGELGQEK
jgi:hypothetical protein